MLTCTPCLEPRLAQPKLPNEDYGTAAMTRKKLEPYSEDNSGPQYTKARKQGEESNLSSNDTGLAGVCVRGRRVEERRGEDYSLHTIILSLCLSKSFWEAVT